MRLTAAVTYFTQNIKSSSSFNENFSVLVIYYYAKHDIILWFLTWKYLILFCLILFCIFERYSVLTLIKIYQTSAVTDSNMHCKFIQLYG